MFFLQNQSIAFNSKVEEYSSANIQLSPDPQPIIYKVPARLNSPVYLYQTQSFVNDWQGWEPVNQCFGRNGIDTFDEFIVTWGTQDDSVNHVLNYLRNVLRAVKANLSDFDGYVSDDDIYVSTSPYYIPDGITSRKFLKKQYLLAWRNLDATQTYFVSPYFREQLEVNPPSTDQIYGIYKGESKEFLVSNIRSISVLDEEIMNFKKYYQNKQFYIVDLTCRSAQARIYLIKRILEIKLSKLEDTTYWQPGIENYNGYTFKVKYDRVSTTFRIGDYTFKLWNKWTKSQPGNGILSGLRKDDKAHSYEEIVGWLKGRVSQLSEFKTKLINRLRGSPIKLSIQNKEEERFLNELSLLFDYEVARRLVEGDRFHDLPILIGLSHLLENFEKTEEVLNICQNLFIGQSREASFKEEIIRSMQSVNTIEQTREILKKFEE